MDRYFAQVLPADKARLRRANCQSEGKKVCFVGDGINDSIALKKANVSISLRGATSIATDTAHIVFMEEGLGKLCDLRDIARDLSVNVRRSWYMILAPNCFAIFGAFTMGFGVMTSVVTNNLSALFALGNGLQPLRKVAAAQAESQRLQDERLALASLTHQNQAKPATPTASPLVAPAAELEPTPVAAAATTPPTNGHPSFSRASLGECLYERPMRRPFDDNLRAAIIQEARKPPRRNPNADRVRVAPDRPGPGNPVAGDHLQGRLRPRRPGAPRQDPPAWSGPWPPKGTARKRSNLWKTSLASSTFNWTSRRPRLVTRRSDHGDDGRSCGRWAEPRCSLSRGR